MFFNFFKKKEAELEKETYEDKQLIKLFYECYEEVYKLKEQVLQTIISNNVVELYPDGTDKNKAIKDSEHEKRMLLCCVATYDLKRTNYINYFEETRDKRVTTKNYTRDVVESHKVIEQTYKNILL